MQITQLAKVLSDYGIRANVWKNARVYINGYGRDIIAWIGFDDPTQGLDDGQPLYDGCRLRVFSHAAQPRNWLINRAKQVKHEIMTRFDDVNDSEDLRLFGQKIHVCKTWEEIIL